MLHGRKVGHGLQGSSGTGVWHRCHNRRQRGFSAALLLSFCFFLTPVLGETVTDVRVGQHPGFIRVVFEGDASPRAEVRKTGPGVFEVDFPGAAQSQPPQPFSQGHLEAIRFRSEGSSLIATLELPFEHFLLQPFHLSRPDRLVLDIIEQVPETIASNPAEAESDAIQPAFPNLNLATDISAPALSPPVPEQAPVEPAPSLTPGIETLKILMLASLIVLSASLVLLLYIAMKGRRTGAVPASDRAYGQRIAKLDAKIREKLAQFDRLSLEERL